MGHRSSRDGNSLESMNALRAKLSRRDVLQRALWLGLSAPAISALLAACGGDEESEEAPSSTETTSDAEPTSASSAESASPSVEDTSSETPATGTESTSDTAWYVDTHEGPPQGGGMLSYLLYEDPDSLNPIVGQTSIAVQVTAAILEPLAENLPDGSWVPILAAELPSQDNGGISEDLLTVTWKLKEGVLWHDGEPFTSEDVRFTWEAGTSVDGGSAMATEFEAITSIDTPDELTAVVTYSEVNVGYLDQFKWIIPQHATGETTDMLTWDFNRAPVGTGPFAFEEWAAADHLTVVKNENYREEGKPYLDGINFLVVPSEESRTARMLEGDGHIMLWPGEDSEGDFEASDMAKERLAPGIWVTQLYFNLSRPYDDDPGAEVPHPILGDLRVRQAITMAINRQRINHEILDGVYDIDSPLSVGWIDAQVEPFVHDPDAAVALLEEAGWVLGDDGVRVAQGAMHAEDGTRMELLVNGYTGFDPIDLGELAIQEDLANVGIQMNIENQDFAIIFGTWVDSSPRKVGDFDMLYYDSGFFIEPHADIVNEFHPTQVPSAENPGGGNIYRWVREDVGEWLDAAGATVDQEERRASYQMVADAIREDIPTFPIQQFNEGSAYSTTLHGFAVSTWEWSTWDSENWWLEQ